MSTKWMLDYCVFLLLLFCFVFVFQSGSMVRRLLINQIQIPLSLIDYFAGGKFLVVGSMKNLTQTSRDFMIQFHLELKRNNYYFRTFLRLLLPFLTILCLFLFPSPQSVLTQTKLSNNDPVDNMNILH